MPLPLRPSTRRPTIVATATVCVAVLAAGGTGYAAAAGKPLKVLSTVCVANSGALSVPKKGGCAHGATLERLASPVRGKTGAPGPAGPAGVPGSNGLATTVTTTSSIDVPGTNGLFATAATCAPGSVATGGGYDLGGYDQKVTVAMSKPRLTDQVATGWVVQVFNSSGATVTVTVYAMCAPPGVG